MARPSSAPRIHAIAAVVVGLAAAGVQELWVLNRSPFAGSFGRTCAVGLTLSWLVLVVLALRNHHWRAWWASLPALAMLLIWNSSTGPAISCALDRAYCQ